MPSKEASARWDAENTVQIKLKLNKVTDADILAKLEEVESKQGYIKELIRQDMGGKKKMTIRMTEEEFLLHNDDIGKIIEGEIYTVVSYQDTLRDAEWYRLIPGDHGGVGGNMDPKVKRYHGWRGTTNDVAKYAEGLRRVEKITKYKNGNVHIKLSGDLAEDKE